MPRVIILSLSLLLLLNPPVVAQSADDIHLGLNPGGHTGKINKLLVTPQGQIVTASVDKTIRVWDVEQSKLQESRKILGQLGGDHVEIYSIALSSDGSLLASGGNMENGYGVEFNYIRLHDFKTGELKTLLKGHENVVQDLAFSPNGLWLASASDDSTLWIWSIGLDQASDQARFVLQGHNKDV